MTAERSTIIVSTKKAKKKSTPKPAKTAKPRQQPMFDSAISSLEKLAEDYVEARDNRIEYLNQEVQIKGEILAEMHKLGKSEYRRNGIEIKVVKEEETIKVKVRPEKDPEVEVSTQ